MSMNPFLVRFLAVSLASSAAASDLRADAERGWLDALRLRAEKR